MHIPVLQKEVLEKLNVEINKDFIDCTLGEGGHSLGILEKNTPKGKVLGIEFDPKLFKNTQLKIKECFDAAEWEKNRITLICDSFVSLEKIAKNYDFKPDGIIFDLGFSSWHLENSERGFSFQKDESLDMRYNPDKVKLTAKKIVNEFSQEELERILKTYGEEGFCKRISVQIIKEREKQSIETTFELIEVIKRATPSWYHRKRVHPATRTFQALRIATNNELESIEDGLEQAFKILKPSGRLVVISFHSLEDRIVKNFFKSKAKEGLFKILTKKPTRPQKQEVEVNPRSRSAKLRAGEKVN